MHHDAVAVAKAAGIDHPHITNLKWHARIWMNITAMTSKFPLLALAVINVIILMVSAAIMETYEHNVEIAAQAALDSAYNDFDQLVEACMVPNRNNSGYFTDQYVATRSATPRHLDRTLWPAAGGGQHADRTLPLPRLPTPFTPGNA